MSVAEVLKQVQLLRQEDMAGFASQVLTSLYPESRDQIDRLIRRLESPKVPEEFWEGVEEYENGKATPITDAHFVAKCDRALRRIFKQMRRDQAEIEKLKSQTRAMVAGLNAA